MRSRLFNDYSSEDQADLRILLRRFHGAKFRTSSKAKSQDRRTYRGVSFNFETLARRPNGRSPILGPFRPIPARSARSVPLTGLTLVAVTSPAISAMRRERFSFPIEYSAAV